MPTDAFFFAGFLPTRDGSRQSRIKELSAVPGTLVFFEAPTRIGESLRDLAAVLGDRPAAVARELTKLHEEVRRGTLPELAESFAEGEARGEIVILVGPPGPTAITDDLVIGKLRTALQSMSLRDAARRRVRGSRRAQGACLRDWPCAQGERNVSSSTGKAKAERQARYRRGHISEYVAAALLTAKGYRILARRYQSPAGEVDLVAKRGKRLVFVEVKRRTSLEACEAAIGSTQRQRVRRAAECWLARHPTPPQLRHHLRCRLPSCRPLAASSAQQPLASPGLSGLAIAL